MTHIVLLISKRYAFSYSVPFCDVRSGLSFSIRPPMCLSWKTFLRQLSISTFSFRLYSLHCFLVFSYTPLVKNFYFYTIYTTVIGHDEGDCHWRCTCSSSIIKESTTLGEGLYFFSSIAALVFWHYFVFIVLSLSLSTPLVYLCLVGYFLCLFNYTTSVHALLLVFILSWNTFLRLIWFYPSRCLVFFADHLFGPFRFCFPFLSS